jgi:hypothetical protein
MNSHTSNNPATTVAMPPIETYILAATIVIVIAIAVATLLIMKKRP